MYLGKDLQARKEGVEVVWRCASGHRAKRKKEGRSEHEPTSNKLPLLHALHGAYMYVSKAGAAGLTTEATLQGDHASHGRSN